MQYQEYHRTSSTTISISFRSNNDKSPLISKLSLTYLTFIAFVAAYRVRDDPCALASIYAYSALILVFLWTLDLYSRLPHNSKQKERTKVWVWALMCLIDIGLLYPFHRFLGPVWSGALCITVGIKILADFCFSFLYYCDGGSASETLPIKAHQACVRVTFKRRSRVQSPFPNW